MYVKGQVVGKTATSILVVKGATHNFDFEGEVKKFGLKLEKDSDCMKAINSKAFTTIGVVKQVLIRTHIIEYFCIHLLKHFFIKLLDNKLYRYFIVLHHIFYM